ncbi:MAG: hypothetical protein WA192_10845, partial [Candidatus Acidiferrales bacterium]
MSWLSRIAGHLTYYNFTSPVSAASATGGCNTIQRIDLEVLARRAYLFACTRSKPSQSSVPAGLILASDFGFCFQCQVGPSLVLRRPIETTALSLTTPTVSRDFIRVFSV